MRKILGVASAGLALFGCSTARMCEEGEDCAPYREESEGSGGQFSNVVDGSGGQNSEGRYVDVLRAECEILCQAFEACGSTIFTDETVPCREQCVGQEERESYYPCEPLYRRYIICMTEGDGCRMTDCQNFIQSYVDCQGQGDALPASANSCVLANNGVCDEPEACLEGSDTNDCAG